MHPTAQTDLAHIAQQGRPVGNSATGTAFAPAPVDTANDGNRHVFSPRYRVLLDGLALRVGPDINAMTVVQLNDGSIVEALPESNQGYWIAVQIAGKRGWVPAQWLLPLADAGTE